MQRDTREELQRLEAELLEAEQPREPEWDMDAFLEDARALCEDQPTEEEIPCRNFANNYGAYNGDGLDDVLEELEEGLEEEPRRSNRGLIVTAAMLLTGIFLVLIYWVLRFLR